ncbi:MAG: 4-hydroxy-tetrahydrodipicolinate reductase [Candidatus Omnitrophota bacterium]
MITLAISGCSGKMGQRIAALASADPMFVIKAAIEAQSHPDIGKSLADLLAVSRLSVRIQSEPEVIKDVDVLIEFSSTAATMAHLVLALKYKKAMVIGTTGFNHQQVQDIERAATKLPIVFSPNMSLGVNLLFHLAREAAQGLGKEYEVRISEAHHVHKKDAPSGTAKRLAEIIKESRAKSPEIPIDSIREGEIVGDHSIFFESAQDSVTLTHHAKTRDILAQGALEAARFVAKQPAGLYGMQNVIEYMKRQGSAKNAKN